MLRHKMYYFTICGAQLSQGVKIIHVTPKTSSYISNQQIDTPQVPIRHSQTAPDLTLILALAMLVAPMLALQGGYTKDPA